MIAPEKDYLLIVVQNPTAAWSIPIASETFPSLRTAVSDVVLEANSVYYHSKRYCIDDNIIMLPWRFIHCMYRAGCSYYVRTYMHISVVQLYRLLDWSICDNL
jgi:hypothetical protein